MKSKPYVVYHLSWLPGQCLPDLSWPLGSPERTVIGGVGLRPIGQWCLKVPSVPSTTQFQAGDVEASSRGGIYQGGDVKPTRLVPHTAAVFDSWLPWLLMDNLLLCFLRNHGLLCNFFNLQQYGIRTYILYK